MFAADCVFSENAKQARVMHHAHASLSQYSMIVMPGLIEILSQGKEENEVFLRKITLQNYNNNFAASIFRSLCEFVGDYFGPK